MPPSPLVTQATTLPFISREFGFLSRSALTFAELTRLLARAIRTRSRALASLVAAIVQIIGNVILGCFLDWQRLSVNARGRYAYIFMMALAGGTWVYAAVVQTGFSSAAGESQSDFGDRLELKSPLAVAPAFDWDDKGWARAWVLYILIQLNFSIIYNHAFWTVGGLAKHPSEIIRFTSIVRGVEAAGGAVAGELDLVAWPGPSAKPSCLYHSRYCLEEDVGEFSLARCTA